VDSIERLVNIGLRENLKLKPKPSLFRCQYNPKILMESLLYISKMLLLERSVVGMLSKISGWLDADFLSSMPADCRAAMTSLRIFRAQSMVLVPV